MQLGINRSIELGIKGRKLTRTGRERHRFAANRDLKLEIATSDDESDVAHYANYVPPEAPDNKWVRLEYDYWSANHLLNANTPNIPSDISPVLATGGSG
jgi:hypothetical protein